jgi:hypothetical protein
MSENFCEPLPTNSLTNTKEGSTTDTSLLKWAERVFADPLILARRIPSEIFTTDQITPDYEAALYMDWQVRDTELGYRFLEEQRERLVSSVQNFHKAIARKERAILFTRARMRGLQKIDLAGNALPISGAQTVFSQLEEEEQALKASLKRLQFHTLAVNTLDSILRPVAGDVSDEHYRLAEQRMRLLGQSWRGWIRVRACKLNFPGSDYRVPPIADGPAPLIDGIVIQHSADAPSPMATDLLIRPEVAAYLRHCLMAIAALSAEMAPYFQSRNRQQPDPSSWSTPMLLLRAIVEFFYFCSFEMPVLSNSLAVSLEEPSVILSYNFEKGYWQPVAEALSNMLKRDSATVAHLILSTPQLPQWERAVDELAPSDEIIESASTLSGLQPYRGTGMARMNINPSTQVFKFQPAYKLTGKLIDRLICDDPYLSGIFQSPLGNGFETITGIAALDLQAFKISGAEQMPAKERFQWLSNFWKTMGKWRPIALLGDNYTKEVSAGITAMGEWAPERSSMVSIQLPILTRAVTGRGKKAVPKDPISNLSLGDQIRLLELLNSTWTFVDEIAMRIRKIGDKRSLQAIIDLLSDVTPGEETDIAKRFNEKWLTSEQPFWNLLRGCAPSVWECWTKLANQSWTDQLLALPPEEVPGALLHLCADAIRIIVLLESISPIAADRLNVDAETACRVALNAFQHCHNGKGQNDPLATIPELIRYYFDFEVPYDAWIAFTSSLKTYLHQLHEDLKNFDADNTVTTIFAEAIWQLELHFPPPIESNSTGIETQSALSQESESRTQINGSDSAVSSAAVNEKDASSIDQICGRLSIENEFNRLLPLKLTALLQLPQLRDSIHLLAAIDEPLSDHFPDPSIRCRFFSTPTATRDIGQFLTNHRSEEDNKLNFSPEARKQLQEYLAKLSTFQDYVESVLGSSPFCRPEDRYDLCAIAPGELTDLLLFTIFDRSFCILARNGISDCKDYIEKFLSEKASNQISNWNPEYLILGAVGLRAGDYGMTLTGPNLKIDPTFTEPERRSSQRLMIDFLSGKYQLASEILRQELPQLRVVIQPG